MLFYYCWYGRSAKQYGQKKLAYGNLKLNGANRTAAEESRLILANPTPPRSATPPPSGGRRRCSEQTQPDSFPTTPGVRGARDPHPIPSLHMLSASIDTSLPAPLPSRGHRPPPPPWTTTTSRTASSSRHPAPRRTGPTTAAPRRRSARGAGRAACPSTSTA